MRQELDRLQKPKGTQDNPVRTCRDLYFAHPHYADGWYWIDPNAGMPNDAIYVFCNMSMQGETCIYPDIKTSGTPIASWRKQNETENIGAVWFSELEGATKIAYNGVGPVQLTFLRLLSFSGYQNFTYSCLNSVAWYDRAHHNHNHALTLMGGNEMDIVYEGKDVSPIVLKDECQVPEAHVGETILMIQTKHLNYLPLIDFRPHDYGGSGQSFGFKIGPACFK